MQQTAGDLAHPGETPVDGGSLVVGCVPQAPAESRLGREGAKLDGAFSRNEKQKFHLYWLCPKYLP